MRHRCENSWCVEIMSGSSHHKARIGCEGEPNGPDPPRKDWIESRATVSSTCMSLSAPRMQLSPGGRGIEREWVVIMRLGPILTRCSAAQAVRSCLLAGLVLMSSLPAPAFMRAAFGDAMRVPSEGQDPLPDDTESPEDEPPPAISGSRRPRDDGHRCSHTQRFRARDSSGPGRSWLPPGLALGG